MKILSAALISVLLLSSCGYEIYPFKSEYPTYYEFNSDKSCDELWDAALTYFGAKKIYCQVIDRSNGIIETRWIEFKHSFTFEKNDGGLYKPYKYIVLARIRSRAKGYPVDKPFRLLLRLQMKISEVPNGSRISMELLPYYINYGNFILRPEYTSDLQKDYHSIYRSTGVFEKEIFNQIK